MHVGPAGDDGLGPRQDNAIAATLLDMDVGPGILLGMGSHTALTLGVGHCHTQGQVAILDVMEIIQETVVILTALTLVCHTPGGLVNGIQGIVGQITLGATTLTAQQSHRLEFGQQILGVPVDVQHPIDGFTGCALLRQHHTAVFGFLGEIVGDTNGSYTRGQSRIISDAGHPITVNKHGGRVVPKALAILGGTHNFTARFHQHVAILDPFSERR